jgi:hypothetical protein
MLEPERREAEAASRDRLAQYVANRRKAYDAFAAVDSDAECTKAARQRLDKAERDLAEYDSYLASSEHNDDSEVARSDSAQQDQDQQDNDDKPQATATVVASAVKGPAADA